MKTLVVNNQKGGVGKTTIATLIAWHLARDPAARVLVIDLDRQSNARIILKRERAGFDSSRLFLEEAPELPPSGPGITVLPSSPRLDTVTNHEAAEGNDPNTSIENFGTNLERLAAQYDYCVIDTAPGWTVAILAALSYADAAIAPVELEQLSLGGVVQLLANIKQINKHNRDVDLRFMGILPSKVERQSSTHRGYTAALESEYRDLVFKGGSLYKRDAIRQAAANGQPIWEYARGNSGARPAAEEVDAVMTRIKAELDAAPKELA